MKSSFKLFMLWGNYYFSKLNEVFFEPQRKTKELKQSGVEVKNRKPFNEFY